MVPAEATELELLERLVGFDTVSSKSNLELIEFVRGWLDSFGIASTIIHDATGTKANLFATIGPAGPPGIVLSGHTDVVPVEGQAWSSDPFRLTRRDGKLYGRGTADMKGFCACVLAMVRSRDRHRDLRSRQYRPGTCGRRVDRGRSAHGLHGLPATAGRPCGDRLRNAVPASGR